MSNINIENLLPILSPNEIIKIDRDILDEYHKKVNSYRQTIIDIMDKKINKFIFIVGPCSVHNIEEIKDYSVWFKYWQKCFPHLFLIMRVYFEKPRSTIGWKGYINDPELNDNNNINRGLRDARKLLEWLTDNDIPIATEFLETFTPQYLSDLVTWGCIGARTS